MANRYWVAGGDGNWSSTANWSTISGGTTGASVPTTTDAVIFDQNSGMEIAVLDTNAVIQTINFTNYYGIFNFNSNTLSLNTSGTVFVGSTLTKYIGTPKVILTYTGASAVTISPGALTELNAISFTVNSGSFALTITSGNTVKNLDFYNGGASTFTGSLANTAYTLYGGLSLKSGMTVTAGATVTTFAATFGSYTVTSNGLTYSRPVTFNGIGGSWQLQDNFSIAANAFIFSNGTLDTNGKNLTVGTVSLGAGTNAYLRFGTGGTWTVSGASFTGGTNFVMTGTATVSMTSASAKAFSGGSVVYPITLDQGGAGALTISGNNAFDNITNSYSATGATTVTFTAASYTKFTAFNLTGTVGKVCTLNSTSATQAILKIAGGVWNVGANSTNVTNNTNLSFVAGSIDYLAISNIYGDNTARYWVGGTASWDATVGTKWAATSGGTGGRAVPTIYDDVYLDANSGANTVTLATATGTCASLICTGFTGTLAGSVALTVQGGITLVAGMTFSYSGAVTFTAQTGASNTITSAGKTFAGALTFGAASYGAYATWTLQDAMIATGGITVTYGTFNTNGFNLTSTNLVSNNPNVRGLSFGASTITLSGTTPLSFATTTNMTLNAGTSTINISGTANTTITAASTAGLSLTFYNLSYTTTTILTHTISGALANALTTGITFNSITVAGPAAVGIVQLAFNCSAIITNGISTTGTAGNRRVQFRSNTAQIGMSLAVTGSSTLTDADFRDLYVTGSTLSGTRLGNLSNCSGITFSTPKTVYWNQAAGGNWTDNAWAASSGGAVSTDNFPLAQDTATIVNTGLNTSATITWNANILYSGSINMSARTNAMTLATGTASLTIYGNWTNGSGTTMSGTGTLTYIGLGTTPTQTITPNGRSFTTSMAVDSPGGTVELGGAWTGGNIVIYNGTFATNNFGVTSSGVLQSNLTNTTRGVNLGTSTCTFAAGLLFPAATTLNLTVTAGSSSITISNYNASATFGPSTWGDVFYTSTSGSGNARNLPSGTPTLRNLTLNSPPQAQAVYSMTITGTFSVTGASNSNRQTLNGSTSPTTVINANALSIDYCDIFNITITGAAAGYTANNINNVGSNSGITFPVRTFYWNLAGTQSFFANGWATSSGGVPSAANFPMMQDTCVFDNAGAAGTVNITTGNYLPNIDGSARTLAMNLNFTSYTIRTAAAAYNLAFGSGITVGGVLSFPYTQAINLASNGCTYNITAFSMGLENNGYYPTLTLTSNLTLPATCTFTLIGGTVDLGTYTLSVGLFQSGTSGVARTFKSNGGTLELSGTGSVLYIYNSWTQTGWFNCTLSNTSATARSLATAGVFLPTVFTIGGTTGSSTTTITGGLTCGELASTKTVAHTLKFGAGSTVVVGKWSITGTLGNVVTVSSDTPASVFTLQTRNQRVTTIDYLNIQDCTFSATSFDANFYAGANSTNSGNNTRISFTTLAARTLYWVGGTGNWSDTAHWSTSSGGPSGAAVPNSADDVVFNSASNATSYTMTLDSSWAYCNKLTVAGPATGTLTFDSPGTSLVVCGDTTVAATGVSFPIPATMYLSGYTSNTLTINPSSPSVTLVAAGLGRGTGGWSLGSAFVTNGNFTTEHGFSFNSAGYTVTVYDMAVNTTQFTKVFSLGATTWTVSRLLHGFPVPANTFTLNPGTSTFIVYFNNGWWHYFNGVTLNNLTIYGFLNGAPYGFTAPAQVNNLNFVTTTTGYTWTEMSLDRDLVVTGTLTVTNAAATQRTFFHSNTLGTPRTLTVNALSLSDMDFRDITLAGAAAGSSITRAGDCGGNSGITFPAPRSVYWNLAGSQNWGSNAWAATSGGVPAATNFPLAQDTAVFDNTGAVGTVTFNNGGYAVGTVDMSARTSAMTFTNGANGIPVYGDWKYGPGVVSSGTGPLYFSANGKTQTITSANRVFTQPIWMSGWNNTLTCGDLVRMGGGMDWRVGGFNGGTVGFKTNYVQSLYLATRNVNLGSGTVTFTGQGNVINYSNLTNFTYTASGATVVFENYTATATTFPGLSATYAGLVIAGGMAASTLTVTGNNTFGTFTSTKTSVTHTVAFAATLTNFGTFGVAGTAGNLAVITGSPAIFTLTGGAATSACDYLNVVGNRGVPYDKTKWLAGANSINSGTMGWFFGTSVVVYAATITETATGTDAISVQLVITADTSDSATATDSTEASFVFFRELSESCTLTDVAQTIAIFSSLVSDAATAAEAVAAAATFGASASDTASMADQVDAPGSVYNPTIDDAASATEAVAAANTLSTALSESATTTDVVATTAELNATLTELSTATAVYLAALNAAVNVSESATGSDADAGSLTLPTTISETGTLTDAAAVSASVFGAPISEAGTLTDATVVAPSVFNAPVVEQGQVLSRTLVAPSIFNTPIVEAAVLAEVLQGAFLWNLIDDSQTGSWAAISNTQTPGWTVVDDSQDPNWQNINTL